MSLTKEQLNKFKKILEDRKTEIEKELSKFAKKDKHTDDGFVANFPDFGDTSEDNAREVAAYVNRLSMEGTFGKELRDIFGALKGINEGTYGICKYCNKEVGEKRLEIRPASSSCVECKKKFKGEV